MTLADSIADPRLHAAPPAPAWTRPLLTRLSKLWVEGAIGVILPNGARWRLGDPAVPETAVWDLRRWGAVARMITRGDIGFAEGYFAGDWDTPDLTALLIAFADNYDALDRLVSGSRWLRGLNALSHALARNSKAGSRRNIMAHYDLGNDFYQRWLDPSMTYSSALFDGPGETLEAAQRAKYAALARSADIQPGHSVLEIGCGWGGFSEFAAREIGANVTAITLSPAQRDFARERMALAGLADRVDVQLIDYRDVRGQFDRVVSIEMFEAVGEAYWPSYFNKIRDVLKPDGKAGLQIITIREALFEAYRRRPDFIQLHIFPGGMLPSEERLAPVIAAAGMSARTDRRFGLDYARTLHDWQVAFDKAWPTIADPTFDERFRRLWRYYLSYCEAGFRTRRTDVVQMTLSKP